MGVSHSPDLPSLIRSSWVSYQDTPLVVEVFSFVEDTVGVFYTSQVGIRKGTLLKRTIHNNFASCGDKHWPFNNCSTLTPNCNMKIKTAPKTVIFPSKSKRSNSSEWERPTAFFAISFSKTELTGLRNFTSPNLLTKTFLGLIIAFLCILTFCKKRVSTTHQQLNMPANLLISELQNWFGLICFICLMAYQLLKGYLMSKFDLFVKIWFGLFLMVHQLLVGCLIPNFDIFGKIWFGLFLMVHQLFVGYLMLKSDSLIVIITIFLMFHYSFIIYLCSSIYTVI